MNMFRHFLALLLLLAFCVEPLAVLAQTVEEAPIVTEEVAPAEPIIEEETAYDASLPGEILATSTSEEIYVEEEPVVEVIELTPGTYVPGEVIVKYEDEESPEILSTDGESVAEVIADLENDAEIEFIEPNYTRVIDVLSSTTDPYAEFLWGLEKTSATEAWTLSTGEDVIVAIIDTGVDYTHPDLSGRMWSSTNCVDENGVVIPGGCQNGWDFEGNDSDPMPEDDLSTTTDVWYHGTHVAGTIAANFNNHVGVIGMAPSVKIMALRFGLDTASEAKAIDFARRNGATIINASFSGSGISSTEQDAIQRFENDGGLFIAAAANKSNDADVIPAYPAAYNFDAIVSVAATTQSDGLASFSNYGDVTVDLGAPGVGILSTLPANDYDMLSGTSMATPHVAGAAALLASYRPDFDAADIKAVLLSTGDPVSALSGKTVSGKRLNAFAALTASEPPPDTTAPIITILGANPLALSVGATFTDPGATAQDAVDGDVTSSIVASGSVDTATAGTYTRTYVVGDAAGNIATSTRDVTVSVVSSGGGGGGGGGGGSKNKKKKDTKTKTKTEVKKTEEPLPRLPQAATSTPQVLGASSYTFTHDLTQGATGADVTELQKALAKLGFFSTTPTTYFGPMTAAAVSAFQKAKGLPVTGAFDASTRAALTGATPASNDAQIAALTAQVAQLLALLKQLQGK